MVFDNQEKAATKMNGIRHMYLNCNKSIHTKLEALEKEFCKSNNNAILGISIGLRNIIDLKIEKLREITTNAISDELTNFLAHNELSNLQDHKKTKRFSKKVIEILETSFKKEKYPSDSEKARLANLCMISSKQVNNWFTNKRNRSKTYKNGFITYDK